MSSHTLTFKNWKGSADLTVNWLVSTLGARSVVASRFVELKITRKSDAYSSRLRMMADLNRQKRTLAWGFLEMTQMSEHPSIDNPGLKVRTIIVLSEVGVQDFKYIGGNEETITFIANKMSEFAIPIGVIGP